MNLIELEEGLRNLIALQPNIVNGQNGEIIDSLKNIIEVHKMYSFRVEEYSHQDMLKIGITNELSRLEMNLVSYACQILSERGINIMLYVPKYATFYNQEIMKYVDAEKEIKQQEDNGENKITKPLINDNKEMYEVVENNKLKEKETIVNEKNIEENKENTTIKSQTKGRDYLMELLKK